VPPNLIKGNKMQDLINAKRKLISDLEMQCLNGQTPTWYVYEQIDVLTQEIEILTNMLEG